MGVVSPKSTGVDGSILGEPHSWWVRHGKTSGSLEANSWCRKGHVPREIRNPKFTINGCYKPSTYGWFVDLPNSLKFLGLEACEHLICRTPPRPLAVDWVDPGLVPQTRTYNSAINALHGLAGSMVTLPWGFAFFFGGTTMGDEMTMRWWCLVISAANHPTEPRFHEMIGSRGSFLGGGIPQDSDWFGPHSAHPRFSGVKRRFVVKKPFSHSNAVTRAADFLGHALFGIADLQCSHRADYHSWLMPGWCYQELLDRHRWFNPPLHC